MIKFRSSILKTIIRITVYDKPIITWAEFSDLINELKSKLPKLTENTVNSELKND